MKRYFKQIAWGGALALGLLLSSCARLPVIASTLKPAKEAEIAKVTAAMPLEAPAKPKKARKILIFSRCKGYVHDSIPIGIKAFEIMGQKTGAFETVVSDDIAMFEPANLKQFDAVIMNNTTGSFYFLPEEIKKLGDLDKLAPEKKQALLDRQKMLQDSFLDFVKSGKGVIGVHAATDCSYEWADYGEMMGGYFTGHPWHRVVPIKNEEPDHVLNKSFAGLFSFALNDEIYVFKEPFSREKLRVILSLDAPNLPAPNTGSKAKRADNDYAISWLHKVGAGRVFYCALGHEHAVFWTPVVLEHYLRGIQYALGDLEADDTPK